MDFGFFFKAKKRTEGAGAGIRGGIIALSVDSGMNPFPQQLLIQKRVQHRRFLAIKKDLIVQIDRPGLKFLGRFPFPI